MCKRKDEENKIPKFPKNARSKVCPATMLDVDQEVKLAKTSTTVVAVEARANLKVGQISYFFMEIFSYFHFFIAVVFGTFRVCLFA